MERLNEIELRNLNERITEIADMETDFEVDWLQFSGKALPYLGWYWRDVDYDYIVLGYAGGVVCIMQKDKWGYPSYRCTQSECETIINQLAAIANQPTRENLRAFYDYLQTFRERAFQKSLFG